MDTMRIVNKIRILNTMNTMKSGNKKRVRKLEDQSLSGNWMNKVCEETGRTKFARKLVEQGLSGN